MADLKPSDQFADAIAPAETVPAAVPAASPAQNSAKPPSAAPTTQAGAAPVTSAQAEQILAELKAIKQNLLWILLLGGFFAARAFLFHY